MFYINYKFGFVASNRLGGVGYPTKFVRNAMPFRTWDEADKFAKGQGIEAYVILRT